MESLKNPIVSRLGSIWGDNLLLVLQSGGSRQISPNTFHDGQYYIIVNDGNSMMEHAEQMTPLIREIATEGGLPAVVAAQSSFLRHLQLNQLMRYMIARDGRTLWGEYALIEPFVHGLDVHQVYAQIAATMLDASAALVPQIMPEGVAEERVQQLQRLTNRLAPGADLLEAAPQVLFARLQQYLDPILRKLPLTKEWAQLGNSPTHPLLPGLQTIYTALDQTYLVFNVLPGEQIIRTDWAKLAEKIPGNCKGIHVTTVAQFALLLLYARPLDIKLRKFQHSWGIDFLSTLQPERNHMLRHAASRPSQLLVQDLPDFFYKGENSDPDFQHHLIHEFQNKLLNIRLEHELLSRLGVVDAFELPGNLPGRETPSEHRIAALIMRLDWWARSYFDLQKN